MPSLAGRTAVVTGASSGIGLITARELARVGASVVLAVRNVEKGERVAATIAGRTEVRHLDVANLASIQEFAENWTGEIDILINNAGIMQASEGRTADGFELQIGTNYLGPFALTNLLLPHIVDRVVTVSSQLHRLGHLHLDDLNWEKRPYNDLRAYSDSKLADVLFTLELQRRLTLAGSTARSIAAHPGIATTSLNDHADGFTAMMSKLTFMQNDAEHGALPSLYAATQDVPGGSYIGPNGIAAIKGYPKIGKPSKAARNAETARQLWELSTQLTDTGTRADTVAAPALKETRQ